MMATLGPFERHVPDLDAYHERAQTGPCFVCGIAGRDPDFAEADLVIRIGHRTGEIP